MQFRQFRSLHDMYSKSSKPEKSMVIQKDQGRCSSKQLQPSFVQPH